MNDFTTDARRFRLLLAEDEDDHAYLVERSIASAPIPVELIRVCDGVEALDYLNRQGEFALAEPPDLLLLDLKLPGVNGLELLEEISQLPRFAALPKVMFSTSVAHRDVKRAYELGANSYLKKPMEFTDFKHMISALCLYWGVWNQVPPIDQSNYEK